MPQVLRQGDKMALDPIFVCLRRGAGRALLASGGEDRAVSDVEEVAGETLFQRAASPTDPHCIGRFLLLYSSGLAAFSQPTKPIFPNSIHFFSLFFFSHLFSSRTSR